MSEPTTIPTDNPDQTDFDPTNRAWRRLHIAVGEHLDVITWRRDDGRPVLLSLVDLRSGDIVTLAVIDSAQIRDPHALLALTVDPTTGRPVLGAYGPFDGATAARSYAPHLAADPTFRGECSIPLLHPDQHTVPDTAWIDMPADLAAIISVEPMPEDACPLAVLLLDRAGGRHAVVGPFPHLLAARAWVPDPALSTVIERHVLALHPAPPTAPPAWLQ